MGAPPRRRREPAGPPVRRFHRQVRCSALSISTSTGRHTACRSLPSARRRGLSTRCALRCRRVPRRPIRVPTPGVAGFLSAGFQVRAADCARHRLPASGGHAGVPSGRSISEGVAMSITPPLTGHAPRPDPSPVRFTRGMGTALDRPRSRAATIRHAGRAVGARCSAPARDVLDHLAGRRSGGVPGEEPRTLVGSRPAEVGAARAAVRRSRHALVG